LHLKTCTSALAPCAEGAGCPTGYNGCEQSRKLLAHYRRCRSIRARQAGQLAGRRESSGHHCLVCSLVARQARTILDRPSISPKNKANSRRAAPSRSVISSFMINSNENDIPSNNMAPPPPRRRLLSPVKVADASAASSSLDHSTNPVSAVHYHLPQPQQYPPENISVAVMSPPAPPPSPCGFYHRQSQDDAMQVSDMQQQQEPPVIAFRQRSASDVGASSIPAQPCDATTRARSASVGAAASLPCETIEEEEVLSDSSSKGSVGKLDFNLDLSQ
jgi:hypothetical protein